MAEAFAAAGVEAAVTDVLRAGRDGPNAVSATLVLANLALAGVYFLEPWLFGRVVDSLSGAANGEAWHS